MYSRLNCLFQLRKKRGSIHPATIKKQKKQMGIKCYSSGLFMSAFFSWIMMVNEGTWNPGTVMRKSFHGWCRFPKPFKSAFPQQPIKNNPTYQFTKPNHNYRELGNEKLETFLYKYMYLYIFVHISKRKPNQKQQTKQTKPKYHQQQQQQQQTLIFTGPEIWDSGLWSGRGPDPPRVFEICLWNLSKMAI